MVIGLVSLLSGIQATLLWQWKQQLSQVPAPIYFASIVYFIFITVTLVVYLTLVFASRIKTNLVNQLKTVAMIQACLTLLTTMALFQIIVYAHRSELARWWFKTLSLLIMAQPLLWLFLPWMILSLKAMRAWLDKKLKGSCWLDVLILLFIAAAVYAPDTEAVMAHMFLGDTLQHMDAFLMAPAWVMAHGGAPNIDVNSHYGLGSIVVLSWLMDWQGGISYTHGLAAIIDLCTVYFMLVYIFLRRWLPYRWLAVACWLMIFKAHIAFEMAYPFVYTYPQLTVVRQWLDIPWLILMLAFADSGKIGWLAGASLTAAVSFWFLPSSGILLVLAHAVMVTMYAYTQPSWRSKIIAFVWPLGLTLTASVALLAMTFGWGALRGEFWYNIISFIHTASVVYISSIPYTVASNQFDSMVFCIIVLTYLATLIKAGLDFLTGPSNDRRKWLLLSISVYGLALLENYMASVRANNYYLRSLPFFLVCFYWLSQWLGSLRVQQRGFLKPLIAAGAFIALVTNHDYMAFPNMLNISRIPLLDQRVARPLPYNGQPYFYSKYMGIPSEARLPVNSLGQANDGYVSEYQFRDYPELIDFFHQKTDFSKDAGLIDSLTSPHDKVVLLSAFEVMMLMQADRLPLFFAFPFLDNLPLSIRSFPGDLLYTREQLQRILDKLQEKKPPFIFMEKIFLFNPSSEWLEKRTPGLMQVLAYVKAHYAPYKAGYYLVAMKRQGA